MSRSNMMENTLVALTYAKRNQESRKTTAKALSSLTYINNSKIAFRPAWIIYSNRTFGFVVKIIERFRFKSAHGQGYE